MTVCLQHQQPQTAASDLRLEGASVHMIGVGGAGMCGAARMLLDLGAKVAGSDLNAFEGMGKLVQAGACIFVGHSADHVIPRTDLVVISAAVPAANPELVEAHELGIPVIKYAQLLGELMRYHQGLAIAGTHGKSTTTAMCAFLLREVGLDPSFVVGATSNQLGGSSAAGSGDHFVVESCEYDRSFLHLHPQAAAILNVEPDHLDYFGSIENVVEAFASFASNVPSSGVVFANIDDHLAIQAVADVSAEVVTLGIENESADWHACNLTADKACYSFDVVYRSQPLFSTRLNVPGRYNVTNALAAIALAHYAGADPELLAQALPKFTGIGRRLTHRGQWSGVTVVDDYAHHPTEIRVTLDAIRKQYVPKRLWVIFQPHQHARTRFLLDDFAAAFTDADEIVIPDIYGAREASDENDTISSQDLVNRICEVGGQAQYIADLDAVVTKILPQLTLGDLVVTMGAGDIWKVTDELVARIRG